MSVVCQDVRREAFAEASRFRDEFYECLTARRDELFELADALLCVDGPVTSPVDLTLVPEHRRGHGALYGALNRGRIDVERLRTLLAGLPLPRFEGGRLVLAVDVSPWLRSDAPCSASRLFCHVYGRALRRHPPAWVLRDLPVGLVGRIRSDRVMRLPKPSLKEYSLAYPQGGRPPKHGKEFRFANPETWPEPAITTVTDTTNYGKAEAQARDRVHPRLTHRSAWLEHDGELPVVEGTLIRLKVEHLSKEREAPPVWLWSSKTGAAPADVDLWWQVFLRRFDLEHTFRFGKQILGWTTPKVRTPQAPDRWTWLVVVAHTQLRLARPLAADKADQARTPHPGPSPPRVQEARVPQPRGAGPGRPPGTKNRHPAPRYDVGKTVKRPETLKAIGRPGRSW